MAVVVGRACARALHACAKAARGGGVADYTLRLNYSTLPWTSEVVSYVSVGLNARCVRAFGSFPCRRGGVLSCGRRGAEIILRDVT